MKNFKIKIHPLFVVFFIFCLFSSLGFIFLLYFLFLCLHEIAHAYVAGKLGYHMKEMKIFVHGAVLYGETDEFSPADEVKIALAGPLFNLFICLITVVLWWIIPDVYNYSIDICAVNLVIALFNILPFYPLDGGRILLAVLSIKKDRTAASRIAKRFTTGFAVILFIIFIISIFVQPNISFGIMSVSLFVISLSEDKNLKYEKVFSSFYKTTHLKRGIAVKSIFISKDATLLDLYRHVTKKEYVVFNVVGDSFSGAVPVTEEQLQKMLLENPPKTRLGDMSLAS